MPNQHISVLATDLRYNTLSSSVPSFAINSAMPIPQSPSATTVPVMRHKSYFIHEADVTFRVSHLSQRPTVAYQFLSRSRTTFSVSTSTFSRGNRHISEDFSSHHNFLPRIHRGPPSRTQSSWRIYQAMPSPVSYGFFITRKSSCDTIYQLRVH